MKQLLGIDYSYARLTAANIKKAGYTAVGRYLGGDPRKDITATEASHLHAAGLGIWLVWESVANRAAQGWAAGTSDAHAGHNQLQALGAINATPLFFAVDFDARPTEVQAYFDAIHRFSSHGWGVYGSIRITQWARARYGCPTWQTAAWSGGKVDAKANLYQRISPTRPTIIGASRSGYDENVLLAPLKLWTPISGHSPTPPPVRPPAANLASQIRAVETDLTSALSKLHQMKG